MRAVTSRSPTFHFISVALCFSVIVFALLNAVAPSNVHVLPIFRPQFEITGRGLFGSFFDLL